MVTSAYVHGLTVMDVAMAGLPQGKPATYRGSEYEIHLTPQVRLDIAIDDDEVDRMVDAILRSVRRVPASQFREGLLYITALEEVVRIRTGEVGLDAL